MDVSKNRIRSALIQEYEEELQPVAYSSKKLAIAEIKYATLEKKCLAIIWGVKKLCLFLGRKKFTDLSLFM